MKNLNKHAYDIVCNWYEPINFNPIYKGIDYSLILRFYLWDKVGRAIRIANDLSKNEVEEYKLSPKPNEIYHSIVTSKGSYKKPLLKKDHLIFIPFPGYHALPLIKEFRKFKKYKLLFKHEVTGVSNKEVVESVNYKSEKKWAAKLIDAVFSGLEECQIKLINEDIDLLKTQILGSIEITQLAYAELMKYKPKALYVHTDNHPPFINYVLVAKKLGIPTFMYQHGLDCEHYYLDDCFADFVAVWSNHRKERYESKSKLKPRTIGVIGNNLLKPIVEFNKQTKDEKTLLFITRPHVSAKCYSPSRTTDEGANILEVILEYLKSNDRLNLIVKPHPMDNFEKYNILIEGFGLKDRVVISKDDISTHLTNVDIVLTEDSTAGVEAMLYNLPCIHTHFAKSKPVLPLVEYNAALSGKNKKEIFDNLQKLLSVNSVELELMKKNQKMLTRDLIPQGSSSELAKFIIGNLE